MFLRKEKTLESIVKPLADIQSDLDVLVERTGDEIEDMEEAIKEMTVTIDDLEDEQTVAQDIAKKLADILS